jgi:hypothetical protein
MAGPALLFGYFHDLLERGVVLTCVTAEEDIQARKRLLLLSNLSCSGVVDGGTQYHIQHKHFAVRGDQCIQP